MNIRNSALSLILGAYSVAGFAQAAKPSIKIVTHVLTLGMPDTAVLEQLGADLMLRNINTGRFPSWLVEQKGSSGYDLVGNVAFEGHIPTSVIRYWEMDTFSGKSLFYAINKATQSLEHDGSTHCRISTSDASRVEDASSGTGSGSVNTKEIVMDCGITSPNYAESLRRARIRSNGNWSD